MHLPKFPLTFFAKGVYKSKSFIYNINIHKGYERKDTVRSLQRTAPRYYACCERRVSFAVISASVSRCGDSRLPLP